MKKLGMNGILNVSRGSSQPPKFIILEYNTKKKSNDTIVLVGKGVTFDSGGISLKPGAGMDMMKADMSGAAAVLGAFKAISSLKPSSPHCRISTMYRKHARQPCPETGGHYQMHVRKDRGGFKH